MADLQTGQDATLPADADDSAIPRADLPVMEYVDASAYVVGGELARGGMGRILAARDRRLRRDVVLKVMQREGAADPRFEREALITARLQHPSIVRVYEAGALGGTRAFYAMERVRGESLDRVIAGAATRRDRLALLPHAIAVADALAYAHNEGIIHRDLKPSNVLVGPFGETVVIDWGLAKDTRAVVADADRSGPLMIPGSRAAPPPSSNASDSALTQHGSLLGTPAYMAPEQARGEPSDTRSDVYALGALVYTLLVGAPPFHGTVDQVLAAVRTGTPEAIAARDPQTPAELVSIVEHAMAREPAARCTAKELADELRRYSAGQLVASHSYGTSALLRRWLAKHRAAVAVAAAALVIVAVVSAVWVSRLAAARDRAERAERATAARSDELVLAHATDALLHDPSAAASMLLDLSPRGLAQPAAHELVKRAAQQGLAYELRGHKDDVELLAMAPDGKHVATGSDDATVRWWSLVDHTFVELRGHTSAIQYMDISRDGHWLATCGTDHDVWLWDLTLGTGRKLAGHTDTVRRAAFSPDNTQLATTGEDGALWLWDVASARGAMLAHYAHGLRPVMWTPDGATVIAGSRDGALGFWTVATGEVRFVSTGDAEVRSLARTRDGARIAVGGEDGRVLLLDGNGALVRALGKHKEVVRDVQFTPDGTKLVSVGGDPIVRVDDVAGGPAIELKGNSNGVKHLAISHDGTLVASAGLDATARVWSIAGGKPVRELQGHGAAVKAVVFTPDDALLVTGSEDDRARVWKLAPDDDVPTDPDALLAWIRARTNVGQPSR